MKKPLIALFLTLTICLTSLVFASCGQPAGQDGGGETNQDAEDLEEEPLVMPESLGNTTDLNSFVSVDLYGNPVDNETLGQYQYTIIDVWGTYCDPCIDAMPEMKQVYDQYKEKGVNVIGIVVDVQNADRTPQMENVKLARKIVEEQDADFTHMLLPKNLLYSIMEDIKYIPTQFLVDSEGTRVSDFYAGGKSYKQWCDILDEKLSL